MATLTKQLSVFEDGVMWLYCEADGKQWLQAGSIRSFTAYIGYRGTPSFDLLFEDAPAQLKKAVQYTN